MGFLTACIEIWTGFYVYNKIFSEQKYTNKIENVVYVIAALLLGTLLWNSRKELFVSSQVLNIYVCTASLILWCMKKKNLLVILSTMWTSYLLIASIQIVFLIGFFSPGNISEVSYELMTGLAPFTIVIYLAGCILMLTVVSMIQNYLQDVKTVICNNYFFILCVDIIVYLIFCVWNDLITGKQAVELQILGIFPIFAIMIGMIISLLFADVVSKYRSIEQEKETLLVREEIARKQYEEQVKMISQNRQIVHDIKNHLLVLKEFARLKETDNIQKYIDEISDDYVVSLSKYWTGHHVIDFILNQKILQAERAEISFTVKASTLQEIPLSESEICALFGNVLDNAIEAASSVHGVNKWIDIRISQKKRMFFVEIANNYEIKPIYRNGEFTSTKNTENVHGYGLKSVKRIVDKYDGMLTYQTENNVFKVNISFLDF